MRWIPSKNGWAVWSAIENSWQLDSVRQDSANWGAAVSMAIEFLTDLGEEVAGIEAELGKKSVVQAMLELAKPPMYTPSHEFDVEPELLGVANGVIDLRNGKVRNAEPDDMILTKSPIVYDPSVSTTLWTDFLRQATGNDAELMEFLQLFFGYSLLGVPDPEWFVLMQGPGGSGKGTFGASVCKAMGEHALIASEDAFLHQQRGGQVREDIIHFEGKRLVAALELPDGASIDHRVIKSLTGGDPIRARGLFKESKEIEQTWALVAACNRLPKIKQSRRRVDSGWWRRVVVIPFHHVPRVSDPELKRSLLNKKRGSPQVLKWLVDGCLEARRRPGWFHKLPAAVKHATTAYRLSEDHPSVWLGDCFTRKVKTFTPWQDVKSSYSYFCREQDIPKEDQLAPRLLKELLLAEGFRERRGYKGGSTQKRGFFGPGLVAESRRVSLFEFVEADIAGDAQYD